MAETVGEQLLRAREERKLSLEQVYQATRINVRYLKGLETNRRDALPSSVQAKGFLRLYADFLNLPVQPLLDTWDGKLAPEPEQVTDIIETAPENTAAEAPAAVSDDFTPDPPALDPVSIEIEPLEDQNVAPIEMADPYHQSELPPFDSSSQVIFKEIGQQMRERRESLGLSLMDVERYTRMRQHYLQAIEAGQVKDLPSLVQCRGMLSNYASFLELDTDAVLLRFAEALQERRLENLPPKPEPGVLARRKPANITSSKGIKRLLTPDLLIGGLVIMMIIAFAIWEAAQVSALRGDKAASTAPPIANILMETTTPSAPLATATRPASAAVAPSSSNDTNSPPAEDPAAGEVTPTSLPVVGDAPLQVYIIAQERAWMRVSEDGKVKFVGRIVPGNAYPFSGKDKIELSSGSAAALQIFFNQQDLGSQGLIGQPISLIFTSKGVVTPTPSFSATPTASQAATLTQQPSPTQATPTVTPFIP